MDKWVVDLEDEGARLLTFIRQKLNSTNETVRWSIENNRCIINGRVERFGSTKVKRGDLIEFSLAQKPNVTFDKKAILFEDDDLLVYNKPPFISTTGEDSLASLSNLFAVHRLDKETSGTLLFGKNKKMEKALDDLFRTRKIYKTYLAIVQGVPKADSGMIENTLGKIAQREGEVFWGELSTRHGGVLAKTKWHLEKRGRKAALLRCHPKTGRTHQLRVHLSGIGHPILGDHRYGGRESFFYKPERILLHANTLELVHPFTNERHFFTSPLPKDFEMALKDLEIK